jgi:phenylacetate-CoA ligase
MDKATEILEPIERASVDELRALQLQRLKWSLAHAYDHVEHYRQSFDAIGAHPADLEQLEDLSKFPFLTKQDFRAAYPFGLFAVPRQHISRLHASSGTTGKPTVVGYTRGDLDTWANLVARSLRAAGARPGDMVHVAYGYGLFTGGLGVHYGAERLGCTVVPVSGGQTERQVQLIGDFAPRVILVTPSYMLTIAEEMERQGIDAAACSLEIGIFGAEPWSESMRSDLERRLGLTALDIYGLSEVMGPGVAQECADSKDGCCIWEDHFYPDGAEGELVFTSLSKEALPVIRYRTRDLTRLLPPTSRSMRRMARITGRSDDMLIVRGVNVFPSQIEELLFRCSGLAPQYEIELTREGPLDALAVHVEHFAEVGRSRGEAAGRELANLVKAHIGISVQVRVHGPGSLHRSEGKARRVLDRRKA